LPLMFSWPLLGMAI